MKKRTKPFRVEVHVPVISHVHRKETIVVNLVGYYGSARTAFAKATSIKKRARTGVTTYIFMAQKDKETYKDGTGRERQRKIYVSICEMDGDIKKQAKGFAAMDRMAA